MKNKPETHRHSRAQTLLERLIKWFEGKNGVLVAFSGGVDSTLVTYAAHKALGDRVLAVTADSISLPPGELEEAVRLARLIGVRHRVVKVDELADPRFVENPPDRCYYCKRMLLSVLRGIASEEGLEVIVDGSNADDYRDFRPGLRALKEFDVRSPLAELGFTKKDVREVSRLLGLPTADKPSMACLASRLPYGTAITYERLRRVSEAESFIRRLTGVKQLRVRDHGSIARIEVGRDERHLLFDEKVLDTIWSKLRSLGYTYVTLDLYGYRSGSLNELLSTRDNAI
ncbi:ATP-dependent sacrificial sulfur transferase LarE [Candidatus Bathyarchaeota archaeon]|nr:ATP-dependent sacrificial sulfur transferase LarE [Candidatus Bathyarchaeota archaeon]